MRAPRLGPAALVAVVAAIVLVVAALAVVVSRDGTAGSSADDGRGWTTVWREDFDGPAGSAPDADRWIVDTGTSYPGGAPQWGTGEIQTYVDDRDHLRLDGEGSLVITADRDDAGAWQSARIETRRADFRPDAGETLQVEARMRLPVGGQGYWAAFWMLGSPFRPDHTDWPAAGEIDVLEQIGRQPASAHAALHCGVNPGGPCQETDGLAGTFTQPEGRPLGARFHTYAVQWDRSGGEDELRWYVDGEQFFAVRASRVGTETWDEATGHGFFLLLNLAVGGGWPGLPDATTAPRADLVVDRVAVSQR